MVSQASSARETSASKASRSKSRLQRFELHTPDILHDPLITIELKDFNRPYFVVGGEVGRPGKYDLRGDTRATEAIAIAGGFNDASKHSQVLLFRKVNNDWYEVKPLNLKRILQGHEVNEDPEIRAGDMLYVPQNTLSKIKKFIPSSAIGSYYQP